TWYTCILVHISDSSRFQDFIINGKVASELATITGQNDISRITHHVSSSAVFLDLPSTSQHFHSCSPDSYFLITCSWPKSVDSYTIILELFRHSENTKRHSVLGHCICYRHIKLTYMTFEPFWIQVQWRADVEYMRIFGFKEMWQAGL
ncbi:hypothetical protein EGW08_000142, partial [Elysia chlorotica]